MLWVSYVGKMYGDFFGIRAFVLGRVPFGPLAHVCAQAPRDRNKQDPVLEIMANQMAQLLPRDKVRSFGFCSSSDFAKTYSGRTPLCGRVHVDAGEGPVVGPRASLLCEERPGGRPSRMLDAPPG